MALILAAGSILEPYSGLLVWKAVFFTIFLIILWWKGWPVITSALATREKTIEDSITRAERALAEAKQIQADNEVARREAEQDARRILAEARESAERLRAEEIDKTRAQLQQMQEAARAEIESEKQGALGELRREVADLAIQAAEKIIRTDMDENRQRTLVEQFIADLPKN
jgi:F-type H+-transporting ATPase subunit b